jgi:GWxTD domain-containing protein
MMKRYFVIAMAGAVTTLGPRPGRAQDCMAAALPEMDRASTRADSLALAEHFATEPPGGDRRCADLLAGVLQGLASTPAQDEWEARRRATERLESALRISADEPRLYLAMANLLYNRQARTDAMRMLDRALERRDRGVPLRPREVAFTHYLRGVMHADAWRDWRSYGQLNAVSQGQWRCARSENPETESFSSTSNDFTWLLPVNQLCPDRFAQNMEKYFESRTGLKRDELAALEVAFARALEADSTYLPAAEALLGEWVYLTEWAKARELAGVLERRFPHDYRPHLYLGLIAHETGNDSLAGVEFGRAMAGMPDSALAAFDDLMPLLAPAQLQWLEGQDAYTQQVFRAAFWTSLDPLYLTAANERKLEHYGRVVATDLMFASPALRERGSQSFAGRIWIRYGRPRHMWELQVPAGRVVFWDLGAGPDLSFIRGTAYRSYRPSDEALEYSNKLAQSSPQAYATTSLFDSVGGLSSQVVRALGEDGRSEVLVHAAWPAGATAEAEAGITLLDASYQPAAQWRGRASGAAGFGTVVRHLAPRPYSLTIEVWDRAVKRLHRLRDTVSALAVDDSAFVVSDLMLAGSVTPPQGGEAVSRNQLALTPLFGLTLEAGQPLDLVWETYRLTGERDGRIRYRVTLEVQDAGRQPVAARLLRGIGLAGERRPEAVIRYDADRPLAHGRTVEWLELTSEFRPGDYRIVLRLVDQATGREVVRERPLHVTPAREGN